MEYNPASKRIDRLAEATPLIKRLLAGETVTHRGEHYQLDRASVGVEPVQKPRPPLAIGAGGPRMLELAAREADIVFARARLTDLCDREGIAWRPLDDFAAAARDLAGQISRR